jgi:hypothetical protein
MDIKQIARDPTVIEIMKDTATLAKLERWAHALVKSHYAPNEPEWDRVWWACSVLCNCILPQIIQPRVLAKYKRPDDE